MLFGVKCTYGPERETVVKSSGPSFDGPVAPARGQQVKQAVSRMRRALQNGFGSAEAAGDRDVLRGGQRVVDGFL